MATPERVSVVGNSGSGKTTLARRIAEELSVPHVELDAIFHQAGWTPLPRDEFRSRVDAATAGEAWVVDGNYSAVRDIVWERADTVVWLDLPRRTVMRQLTLRTLRRAVTREELWNTNREPLANFLRWDPEQSILRWAWTRHQPNRERYAAAMVDPRWNHLAFVRLTSVADAERWVAALRRPRSEGT